MRSKKMLAAVTLAAVAQLAAAAPAQDELGSLLEKKGLVARIGESIQHARDRAAELVVNAMGSLGVPYRMGGNSAETGFDCSGFVRAMVQQTGGRLLPRRAEEQAAATAKVEKSDMKPGDLVFFNTMRRTFSHVGIYVGDGKFIHSPRTGSHVRVENMNIAYWQSRFDGARRVLDGDQAAAAAGRRVIDRDSSAPSAVRLGAGAAPRVERAERDPIAEFAAPTAAESI